MKNEPAKLIVCPDSKTYDAVEKDVKEGRSFKKIEWGILFKVREDPYLKLFV